MAKTETKHTSTSKKDAAEESPSPKSPGIWYHSPSKLIKVKVTKPTPDTKLGISYRQCHSNDSSDRSFCDCGLDEKSQIVITKVKEDGLFRTHHSLCRLIPDQEIVAINDTKIGPGTSTQIVSKMLADLTGEVTLKVRTAQYKQFSVGYETTMNGTKDDPKVDLVVPKGATSVPIFTTTKGSTSCDLPDIFRQAHVPVELYRYIVDTLLCGQMLPHADQAIESEERMVEALSRYNMTAIGNGFLGGDTFGDVWQWDQQKQVFEKTSSASNCATNATFMMTNVLMEANALLNSEYKIKVQSRPTVLKSDTVSSGVLVPTAFYFSTF
mmetsp:Transcript_7097/g.17411  ORF Transcript_7097/g.17411 Transcript_7097/m.17411 type:complete len:325 (-) Transcript_7097:101-1075(-)